MINEIKIHAFWDEEAKVWVATSEGVAGLATEVDTIERLLERLQMMIPELLDLNGQLHGAEIPFHPVSERSDVARIA